MLCKKETVWQNGKKGIVIAVLLIWSQKKSRI